MTLDKFFNAKNIAIIGVSRNPNKIGHIILRNFIDSGYNGNIFIVNPNAGSILNKTSYKKVSNINEDIDLAVIAVPAELVFDSVKDCNKKRIKRTKTPMTPMSPTSSPNTEKIKSVCASGR